eukprot:765700-Hanusia_phi.AAC.4
MLDSFHFHHASKEKGVTMYTWLSDAACNIPNNASHYVPCSVAPALPDEQQVGVGVAVMDDQDRILVVQEKFGPAARRGKDFWKVPTGLVESGEDIAVAAEREVGEGKPLNSKIVPQDNEIARVRRKWEQRTRKKLMKWRIRNEKVYDGGQERGRRKRKEEDVNGTSFRLNGCRSKSSLASLSRLKARVTAADWERASAERLAAYWFLNRLAAESFLQGRGCQL